MSLVTLTFGGNYSSNNYSRFKEVSKPLDNLKPTGNSTVEVKKVTQFFGERNLYVVGEVKKGVLAEQMKSIIGEKNAFLVEIESKFGHSKAKEGMTVGLSLAGIEKEELQKGQLLEFTP